MNESEKVYCIIMESIYSCPYGQDNNDVYVKAWLYDLLKEHPKSYEATLSDNQGAFTYSVDPQCYPVNVAIGIGGKTFIVYPECNGDFTWYAQENYLVDDDILISEMVGFIHADDNKVNRRNPLPPG